MICIKINDRPVQAGQDETILQAAARADIYIPTLCHLDMLEPAGLCRICTVEVFDGKRTKMVTACNYPVRDGIEVRTDTKKVKVGRAMILELLLARCPDSAIIRKMALEYGIKEPRFPVEKQDCIVCGLCVRVCEEYAGNVLLLSGRSHEITIEPPFGDPGKTCIGCGMCASVCPTGIINIQEHNGERFVVLRNKVIGRLRTMTCPGCGTPTQPEKLSAWVREKMGPDYIPVHLDLCDKCKRRTVAERMAASQEPGLVP
ncbi:MAG: 2Fe-2S iron-sulfur cluster-binding protein [Desulfonatronovibrio sp.]